MAVRTSLRRLDEALKTSGREWLASRMIYRDLSHEIDGDEACNDDEIIEALRRPFLLKQREYQAENEVRLITVDPEASEYIRVDEVRPECWIEEIRISPNLWSNDAELLKQHILAVAPDLAARVRRSLVSCLPKDYDTTLAALYAEMNRDAATRWPEVLRRP